jgi:uncharacterized protein YfaS (alpha-2-macroglobulin family)
MEASVLAGGPTGDDRRGSELKTPNEILTPTRLRHPPAYAPLPGLTLSDRFRYPVHRAKPIVPPADVKLAGSSSEFLPNNEGNVRVPLGQRAPGLYLVEASVGKHRAVTLVFVSDSVAVTKNAATEMLVWTARRKDGVPSPTPTSSGATASAS